MISRSVNAMVFFLVPRVAEDQLEDGIDLRKRQGF